MGASTVMIYVRSPRDSGLTRVLMVPGITRDEVRSTATWHERIGGVVCRVRATYVHETGGVPVLVEEDRQPCPDAGPETPLARRMDAEDAPRKPDRDAQEGE